MRSPSSKAGAVAVYSLSTSQPVGGAGMLPMDPYTSSDWDIAIGVTARGRWVSSVSIANAVLMVKFHHVVERALGNDHERRRILPGGGEDSE